MTILSLLGLLFAGGLVALLSERINPQAPRWIALGICLIAVVLLVPLFGQVPALVSPSAQVSSSWIEYVTYRWIPRFGISFIFAMDGLSLLMVSLTIFLGLVAIVSSWHEIGHKPGLFQLNLLFTLAGVIGVFTSLDLFLFFFFWEVMLIPMYFLIAIWGHEKKTYAAMKFFLFTQISGMLMLVAILTLVLGEMSRSGQLSFSYFDLLHHQLPSELAYFIMLGFFVAFIVKLPALPFHSWLPDAHTQAPTAASVILAGILLKTGAYGLMRFVLPLFPDASHALANLALCLGAVGIVYGALLAFAQTDFKRLVAYSSVSHMGFVLVGIYGFNQLAITGAAMQMIAHGLSTAALFMLAGALQQRLGTRDMSKMGGLWQPMPRMGAIALFFIVASLGMPGLGNFVGEFLVLLGLFSTSIPIAILASLGLIGGAIYALIAMQKVFYGEFSMPFKHGGQLQDFAWPEMTVMTALMLGLIALGVYPQPIFAMLEPVLTALIGVVPIAASLPIGAGL